MSATGAVALNVQMEAEKRNTLAAQNQHRADQNRQSLSQLGYALGQQHEEGKLMAAGKAHLVSLGADPAEADAVLATKKPEVIQLYMQQLESRRRVKNSLELLGYGGTAGAAPQDQGGAMIPWGSGDDAGAATPPAAADAGAATPTPTRSTSTVGGTQMQSTGFPNTSPSAWPSRQELLRRYAGGAGGGNAAALEGALHMLPPELTPVQQAQIERDKVGVERDRFEMKKPQAWVPTDEPSYMRTHPHLPPVPREPNPDHRVLTPAHAKSMGLPAEWADGETTVGEAMTRAGQVDVGKPGKPAGERGTKATNFNTPLTPAEEQQFQDWKRQYAPNDSGMDYDLRGAFKAGLTPDPQTGHWPDTFKKPNHPTFSNQSIYAADEPGLAGTWDGEKYIPHQDPLANIGRELGVQRSQREAQDYESPAYKDAKKRYDTLIAKGMNLRDVAVYPGGKKQLEADVNAAKAAMEAAKSTPAPTPGPARPNFPPVVPPAPPPVDATDEQPTQEDIDFETSRGNVWDPVKKGFVPARR
jgi:hypothetical protein